MSDRLKNDLQAGATHRRHGALRCAAAVLTVVTGSIVANLAGCGGGGGGTIAAVPTTPAVNRTITITGRVQLNSGDLTTTNCNILSPGISAPLELRVRDLNDPNQPIVATATKPDQSGSGFTAAQRGLYTISGLARTGTFRVEARQVRGATAPFTGRSAAFTVSELPISITTNICANASTTGPDIVTEDPNPTATPTRRATSRATATFSATATTAATRTPTPAPTATRTRTATPTPTGPPTP